MIGVGSMVILFGTVFSISRDVKASYSVDKGNWRQDHSSVGLSNRQESWINALEWCESNGDSSAINPEDLDGTPSYGSFQFKPETMIGYGIKYGIWNKDINQDNFFTDNLLMMRDLQREIVENMVIDKTVNFRQQFPACTKKLGLPPTN